jgi:hypothetical protein
VPADRKAHQTTIRFTDELWARLEKAADDLDVSVAHYVRDAARARLEAPGRADSARNDPATAARKRSADIRQNSLNEAESSAALWEQGRLARERARILRAEARERHRQSR